MDRTQSISDQDTVNPGYMIWVHVMNIDMETLNLAVNLHFMLVFPFTVQRVFGNKIKIIGSIRPIISIMFASRSSGEKSWWIISTEYGVPPTTGSKTISGWANEFKFLSFDLAFNTRIEYKLNEKLGVLLECQYSKGINNISNNGDFEYNFQNLIIGTGIRVQLSNNNCSAFD